jgi:hypothetical protein
MKNVSAELIIKSPFDMTKLKSREMVVKPLLNLRAILNHPVMEKNPFPTLIKIKPTVPSTLASFVPDPNYVEPFSRLSEAVNQKLDTYAPEVHNKGEKIIAKTGERTPFKQYRFFLGRTRNHLKEILNTVIKDEILPQGDPFLLLVTTAQEKVKQDRKRFPQVSVLRQKSIPPKDVEQNIIFSQLAELMLVFRFLEFSPSEKLLQELLPSVEGYDPLDHLPF